MTGELIKQAVAIRERLIKLSEIKLNEPNLDPRERLFHEDRIARLSGEVERVAKLAA